MYIPREKTALHGRFAHPSRRNRPLNRFYPFRFLLIVTIMKVPLLAERPVPVPNPSAHSPFLSSVQKEMRPYQHRATARILLSFLQVFPTVYRIWPFRRDIARPYKVFPTVYRIWSCCVKRLCLPHPAKPISHANLK